MVYIFSNKKKKAGMGLALAMRAAQPTISSPTQLPNLFLWLKADAGTFQDVGGATPAVTNGDPVKRWVDQSGGGLAFTWIQVGLETDTPLMVIPDQNGLPGLTCHKFAGGMSPLQKGILVLGNVFTIFAACKPNGSASFRRIICQENTFFFGRVDNQIAVFFGNGVVWNRTDNNGGPVLAAGTTYILGGLSDGALGYAEVNGTLIAGRADVAGNLGGIIGVGNAVPGATQEWEGDLFEIIVYSDFKSQSDRTLIRNYLNSRWAAF